MGTPQSKPSTHAAGYQGIQEVEPITSLTTNLQVHAKAVRAPAVVTDLAPAGAAFVFI
ncbi:hypothetical protein HKL94_02235 [Candidatus Parcubacteria bacterium]|nr:hypothetical protein [Candidatus Parcubacteria bacterium]